MILVDSDWIIDGLSGREAALQTLADVSRQGAAVSAITLAEVLEGAYLRPNPAVVHYRYLRFLEGYPLMPVTSEIADTFARIRADLRKAGNLNPDFDLLIASTAIVNGMTLLTRNRRHFERVPGLHIYQAE